MNESTALCTEMNVVQLYVLKCSATERINMQMPLRERGRGRRREGGMSYIVMYIVGRAN